uniref:Uncharacterized protein n=1 Tax=Amphimedon queenslandica TaxID=400682 RepID=A0A1X7U2T6_AMPQE
IFSSIGNSRFSKFCFQEPGRLPLHCYEDRNLVSVHQNQDWSLITRKKHSKEHKCARIAQHQVTSY